MRGDPDNSDVVGLLKKVKLMETKKKEGKCTFALFEIFEMLVHTTPSQGLGPLPGCRRG